ncbi:nucleotide pyrophosphohydrolase [Halobacteriovorax sp. JY17]|uniref:nucleotide pyrophosphohydrolase n=1 Tax=Halobacteriovorax sp. JY17 TaxID=2014617 RepID=UPI000C5FBB0A|nr:nucleotide pyrophosphohydrolase [Halobacteriovorax sp. JY17]PIK14768.1 MAG: nucleotide pyrophosphohydrolase [Halobacteriovorax sp. JY17]
MKQVVDITKWQERLQSFAVERDWEQFHNPKNLAMALSVETSELLEIFQWLSLEQSEKLSDDLKLKVEHEAADILLYLMRITDLLDIDLAGALEEKFRLNGEKYPLELSRGTAKKYSELKPE